MFYLIRAGENIDIHMPDFCQRHKEFKESWFRHDKKWDISVCHRKRGPSVTYKNGKNLWHEDGEKYSKIKTDYSVETFKIKHQGSFELHSFSDNPSVVYNNGTKEWHSFGELHRELRPAVVYSNGDKEWWIHGKKCKCSHGKKEYCFL
ncbi:MAG: hypothetical protein EKK64_00750 [Neisseriaceae bacterium]|nr:MAG: hypothetical protein EKK64_00750 [Neisseriaceae bacterium]